MHPVVYTYLVRYEFKEGQQYMALARGALAGMASTVYLHDGHTGPESATLLYDCELKPWGAQAFVRSFGLPDFPGPGYSRGDRSVAINLEVRLTNGKILNFYADVTDQLLAQPWGGVIIVKDLVITPDQGKPDTPGSGGSFDVSVDGWGDFQDIDIPFGS